MHSRIGQIGIKGNRLTRIEALGIEALGIEALGIEALGIGALGIGALGIGALRMTSMVVGYDNWLRRSAKTLTAAQAL